MLKYEKVKHHLQRLILDPSTGRRLPTIRALQERFHASLTTVNRALAELEAEGLIVRRRGSGIRIASPVPDIGNLRSAESGRRPRLLFFLVDYPDEELWKTAYVVRAQAQLLGFETLERWIAEDTPPGTILRFAQENRDAAGIILHYASGRIPGPLLRHLGELPQRTVLLNSQYVYRNELPAGVRVVSADPASSARICAKALLERGHRRIGYLCNEPENDYTAAFQKTLANVLREHGAQTGQDFVFRANIRSWENAMVSASRLTEENLPRIRALGLTALVYQSTAGVLAALRPLAAAGLRVPGDISLVGEGARDISAFLLPRPAYSDTQRERLAALAVKLAVGKASSGRAVIQRPCRFVAGETIGPAPFS